MCVLLFRSTTNKTNYKLDYYDNLKNYNFNFVSEAIRGNRTFVEDRLGTPFWRHHGRPIVGKEVETFSVRMRTTVI